MGLTRHELGHLGSARRADTLKRVLAVAERNFLRVLHRLFLFFFDAIGNNVGHDPFYLQKILRAQPLLALLALPPQVYPARSAFAQRGKAS